MGLPSGSYSTYKYGEPRLTKGIARCLADPSSLSCLARVLPTMDEKEVKTPVLDSTATTPRNLSKSEIEIAPKPGYEAPKAKAERLENARGDESDNLIHDLEKELEASGYKKGFLDMEFKNTKHFTWILVAFASMGGLLSGLDQSLISGANLTLPRDLDFTAQQNSMVNSGMPLGGMSIRDQP